MISAAVEDKIYFGLRAVPFKSEGGGGTEGFFMKGGTG